jgi:hypothetical protein
VPACCPICSSNRIARAHTRWYERPRRWITGQAPRRCRACYWRGWPLVYTERRHDRRIRGSTIVLALVILFGVIPSAVFWSLRYSKKLSSDVRSGQPSEDPVLLSLSTHAYPNSLGDIWYVEGQVQNLTKHPLTNVQVVVTWFNATDSAIATIISLLDLERLPPGEISMYRTSLHTMKGMSKFDVRFQSDLGQLLSARGDRQGSIDSSATTEPENSSAVSTSDGMRSSKPVSPP